MGTLINTLAGFAAFAVFAALLLMLAVFVVTLIAVELAKNLRVRLLMREVRRASRLHPRG